MQILSKTKINKETYQSQLFAPKEEYKTITNERALLIKDFLDRLNLERQGTKWKPLTARAVAIKLSHLNNFDLKFFYKQCSNAKSFTGCFWGSLKTK